MSEQPLLNHIFKVISGIKGQHIKHIDLSEVGTAPARHFVVCEGTSTTHVSAIAQAVERKVREKFQERPLSNEGGEVRQWILLDYFDIIVHIFLPETRKRYDLESLWGDGKISTIE